MSMDFNWHNFGNLTFEYNSLETCFALFKMNKYDEEKIYDAYGFGSRDRACSETSPFMLYDEDSGSCGCVKYHSKCHNIPYNPVSSKMFKVFDGNKRIIFNQVLITSYTFISLLTLMIHCIQIFYRKK